VAGYAGVPLPEPKVDAWRVRDEHLAWHRENIFLGQVPLPSTIAQ